MFDGVDSSGDAILDRLGGIGVRACAPEALVGLFGGDLQLFHAIFEHERTLVDGPVGNAPARGHLDPLTSSL
jgi:hypothetical protein